VFGNKILRKLLGFKKHGIVNMTTIQSVIHWTGHAVMMSERDSYRILVTEIGEKQPL
jgi:hypothetical protein